MDRGSLSAIRSGPPGAESWPPSCARWTGAVRHSASKRCASVAARAWPPFSRRSARPDGRSAGGRAQHVPGDDHLLDLARTFVDPEEPGIAVEALDGDATHVARAAVNLHGSVGYPVHHLAAEIFGT